MMLPLRGPRLLVLLALILVSISLYAFYPTDPFRRPHSPDDAYDHYEAGGIDSEHYNAPVVPDFEDEGCDGPDGSCLPPARARLEKGVMMDEEMRSDRESQEAEGQAGRYGSQRPIDLGHAKNDGLTEEILGGGVIMPKLENATAKAELGRAAWRVMHLMTLRYPENPTPEDRTALKSYFHLFSRLYPCGECAEEFQKLLKEYPPQTSSRKTASMWLCSVHNMVNERLGKPDFDCLTLNDVYDCGCGPEGENKEGNGSGSGGAETAADEVAEKGIGTEADASPRKPYGGATSNKRPVHLVNTNNDGDNERDKERDEEEQEEEQDEEETNEKLDVDEAEDVKTRLESKIDEHVPDLSHQQYKQEEPEEEEDGEDEAEGDEDAEGKEEEEGKEDGAEGEKEQQFRILPIDGTEAGEEYEPKWMGAG